MYMSSPFKPWWWHYWGCFKICQRYSSWLPCINHVVLSRQRRTSQMFGGYILSPVTMLKLHFFEQRGCGGGGGLHLSSCMLCEFWSWAELWVYGETPGLALLTSHEMKPSRVVAECQSCAWCWLLSFGKEHTSRSCWVELELLGILEGPIKHRADLQNQGCHRDWHSC